jgi:hypothetical protein
MRNFFKIMIIPFLAVFLCSGSAMAIPTINGVFDTTEWAGYFSSEDNVTASGYVGPGVGGQAYDVERLGLYVDSTTVYFGLQTGFPVHLAEEPVHHYEPGDFAINVDADGFYEYAIDYTVSGNAVTYNLVDMSLATWINPVIGAHASSSPWEASYGSGDIVLTWTETTGFGSGNYSVSPANGLSYVLEGAFALSNLSYYSGGDIGIHWTMECGNDVLNHTTTPVPEPATMLLLGTGLIGLAGMGRKKLIKK